MRIIFFFISLFLIGEAFCQTELQISIPNDSAVLSGTLLLPSDQTPLGVVLFFSGSGPTDRDGNTGSQYTNNSLKMLAKGLAKNGIASLRYDKRGIGKSKFEGGEADLLFEDFVSDGQAWLELLSKDERFDDVYVLGHSQGSLVAALVASDDRIKKYISVAGISRSADEVILSQLQEQSPFMGVVAAPKLDSLKEGHMVSDPGPPLNSIFRQSTQPFLMSWFAYDPADIFSKLDKPILVINGTTDIQVPVKEAEELHKAAPRSELHIIEGMNHVLKDAPLERMANLEAYSDSIRPLSEGLVERIVEFLNVE
jgi:pimeloyl-ACP methyl ester carboxylesterase